MRKALAIAVLGALGASCAPSAPHQTRPLGPLELPVKALAPDESDLFEVEEPTDEQSEFAKAHGVTARKIISAAMTSERTWKRLEYLSDQIGHRLSGSKSLDRAIEWAVAEMKKDGHENIRTEKVMVPHWERGSESAAIVAPSNWPLSLLALGGSAGTPPQGVTAEVLVVSNWDEFDALGDRVKGRMVLFNRAMPPFGPDGHQYGATVPYRTQGPRRAGERGAVAALVRSVTAHSLRTPHTGMTSFGKTKPIPAAAITVEDAELIARLAKKGPVEVKLTLGAKTFPDAESANVLAELRGREKPEEIVVIGGHLDTWDVGQGAHDDGGGCVIMMEALTLLRELGLTPRRTIRVVLFTNEENGLRGARAYAQEHASEKHVAAIESDSGIFAPEGFRLQGNATALAQAKEMAQLLEPIGATSVTEGFSGADIMPLGRQGVPTLGLAVDASKYFDYHHSPADTLDKVDPKHLKQAVATVAVMAWALAEAPTPLGTTGP